MNIFFPSFRYLSTIILFIGFFIIPKPGITQLSIAPEIDCNLVDPNNINHNPFFPICDINILDGYTSTMTDLVTGNGPTPLCDNGGAPHNIAWFSFVAGSGDYTLTLTPTNCTDANGVPPGTGIQSGIYNNCSFDNQVGECIGIPCSLGEISISNIDANSGLEIFVPGDVYYWFIDGCSGTTCEFSIEVSGNFIPFPQDNPERLTFTQLDTSGTKFRTSVANDNIGFGTFYWTVDPISDHQVLNSNTSDIPYATNTSFLDLEIQKNKLYTVCLDSILSDCVTNYTRICDSIYTSDFSINGFVYIDENENGIIDTSELGLPSVKVMNGNRSVLTDSIGYYQLKVDSGEVNISAAVPYGSWVENQKSIDTIINNSILENINFPFVTQEGNLVLHTSIVPIFARCNTTRYLNPSVTNLGSVPIVGELQVEIDSSVEVISSIPPFKYWRGNTYYYDFERLIPGATFSPRISVSLPGVENEGDSLCFVVTAVESTQNITNTSTSKNEFRCSYDPNDKTVLPDREGSENYTLRDELLDYTVRFQNNGNDTAFHVRIVDVLDPNIDTSSFLLINWSHPVTVSINEDSIFFDFFDIMLVDSMTNVEAAQGFVHFGFRPLEGVPENTIIQNTASIYFDQNPPIITNTVQNTIVTYLPCDPVLSHVDTSFCRNEIGISIYPYTESGTYIDTFNLFDNCDSIRTLNLIILEESFTDLGTIDICDGDSYLFNGSTFEEDGTYEIIVGNNALGCDSIVQFSIVTHFSAVTIISDQYLCEGDSIEIAGMFIDEAGDFSIPAGLTQFGCDSTVNVSIFWDVEENCLDCEEIDTTFLSATCEDSMIFCDLSALSGKCFDMLDTMAENGPIPLCPNGGQFHNISWFAFVAGTGAHTLRFIPNDCQAGIGGQAGIQFGIYTNCTFEESIFCQGIPFVTDTILVDNGTYNNGVVEDYLLIPGEIYYVFFDGASGSVCNIQFDIIGEFEPFDFPVPSEAPRCFIDSLSCNDTIQSGQNVTYIIDAPFGTNYWSILPERGWTINGQNDPLIKTDSDSLTITFEEEGEYVITWESNDHPCFSEEASSLSTDVYVQESTNTIEVELSDIRVYPNPTNEQINYVLDDIASSDYELLNTAGRSVLRGKSQDVKTSIDLHTLSKGVYILKVRTDKDSTFVKRVIKF